MAKVVVLGSCMIDLTCFSRRLPNCGETIHGTSFQRDFGGKGANQCIASTRLGAKTALVACLGDDIFGKEYLSHLRSNGVDTSQVALIQEESCGVAQISVADNGENTIVIVAGANNQLDERKVVKAASVLNQAAVVLFQFETPVATTLAALKHCKQHNPAAITVVNASPATSALDVEMFKYTDFLCVNEVEAEHMTGMPSATIGDCEKALGQLLTLGCGTVIITLGREGAIFGSASGGGTVYYEQGTPQERPVDTTGAGDAFLGALAYLLAYRPHWPLQRKVQVSCSVAALSVTKRGTQASFPSAKDLPPAWLLD